MKRSRTYVSDGGRSNYFYKSTTSETASSDPFQFAFLRELDITKTGTILEYLLAQFYDRVWNHNKLNRLPKLKRGVNCLCLRKDHAVHTTVNAQLI